MNASTWPRYRALLRQRGWVMVVLVFTALAGQGTRLWLEPPRYLSTARLILNYRFTLRGQPGPIEERSAFFGTQLELIKSESLQERAHGRVLPRDGLTNPPPVTLEAGVLPQTTIFLLRATSTDSNYVRPFLRACVDEYLELQQELRHKSFDPMLAGGGEELARLEADLAAMDAQLAECRQQNRVPTADVVEANGRHLQTLYVRRAGLQSELSLLGTDKSTGESLSGADHVPPAAQGLDLSGVRQKIRVLEAELTEQALVLRPRHPRMVALREEIARCQRAMRVLQEQGGEQQGRQREAVRLQLEQLEREIGAAEVELAANRQAREEYVRLESRRERTVAFFDRLHAFMQLLSVNEKIVPQSVTVFQNPSPALLWRPPVAKPLLAAALVGLLAGGLAFWFLERFNDRIATVVELRSYFGPAVLGEIPRQKTAPFLAGGLQPAQVEAYRGLRSALRFRQSDDWHPLTTLVVTSAEPGEGKTTTAAQLAVTLAESGARTLLVDADLRRGCLHERLGVDGSVGLSDVLARGQDWRKVAQSTRWTNLRLLPRGRTTANASELFLLPMMREFLSQAAEEHDLVVLDTAPVLAADDAASLAPLATGVIFVVRAERTSARVVRAGLALLMQRRIHLVGLVLNAVSRSSGRWRRGEKARDSELNKVEVTAKIP